MKCKVKVIETLSRVIEVDAENEQDAFEKVRTMHQKELVVLDADDFESVEFYPCGKEE